MLATPAPAAGVPTDADAWAYEVKWDGMRVLVDVRDGVATPLSRTGRDVSTAFPEFAAFPGFTAPAGAPTDVLLDGEVVALTDGVPSFSALADRMHVRDARTAAAAALRTPVTFVVFDVLRLHGVDLLDRPWQERRGSLDGLPPSAAWQVSPVYPEAASLLVATAEQGLEGIVAKRRTSRYRPGTRSPDWVKLAHRRYQACLVVGFRPVEGGSSRMGALLLAVPGAGGDLRYVGRAGSGLGSAMEEELRAGLAGHEVAHPVVRVPRPDAVGATFTEPVVVVEVRHLGSTTGGRLRQPTLRGVRTDLAPSDVRPE